MSSTFTSSADVANVPALDKLERLVVEVDALQSKLLTRYDMALTRSEEQ